MRGFKVNADNVIMRGWHNISEIRVTGIEEFTGARTCDAQTGTRLARRAHVHDVKTFWINLNGNRGLLYVNGACNARACKLMYFNDDLTKI